MGRASSRPQLVRLTSRLFERAFADLLPAERVWLEPALEKPGMGPCLEWWKLATKGNAKQPRHALLASTLRAFLADETVRVRDPRSGEVRRPRPGDVAVLSWRRATCQAVAEELEVRVTVREEEPVAAARPRPSPGEAPVLAGPGAHPPARVPPSALQAPEVPFRIGEVVSLGSRIPLRGTPEIRALGEAVHAFLAADHKELPGQLRLELAGECLARWGVAPALAAEDLLEASSAFQDWIEDRWPGALGSRKLPLAQRLPSGTLRQGSADLVLRTDAGLVLVDHKTFPGSADEARFKALSHAGQLEAYVTALAQATGAPVLERWIHLPVSGLAMRLEES